MRAIPLRDPCRLVKNNNSDGSKQAEGAHILRLLLECVVQPLQVGLTTERKSNQEVEIKE